jgi:hypothetical protein
MRKFIPVEEVAKEWMKDPEFVAAYDALEDEFAVASALIKARTSGLTPRPSGTSTYSSSPARRRSGSGRAG